MTQATFVHGLNGYDRFSCRCSTCKAAKKAKNARFYSAHRESLRKQDAAYYLANKHKKAAWAFKRNLQAELRVREAGGDLRAVTYRDWLRLLRRHNNQCAYCKSREALTWDHVVPVSRGGRHAIGNLLPACKACNSSKHNRYLVEWRRRPKL